MLVLYYFRWVGTPEEFKEYIGRVMGITQGIEGVNFMGVFVPSNEWNAVTLFEATSFDKTMEIYKTYMQKFGDNPKIPLAKIELLYKFEELGYPT